MKQETRKEEIVRVAAKLFKEKGYSAVTMRDLARAMGIKAASLYNHINSKQDILNAIIISLAEEFTEGMKLIQSSGAPCIEKLKHIIELHVKISSQNIYGMASLNNDWMHLEEKLDYYQKLRVDYEDDFKTIQQGYLAGNGLLSKHIGINGAGADFLTQLIESKESVDKLFGTLDTDFVKIIEAYSQGLNKYAETHPDEILEKKLFPITPKK